jgi:hypothetical protein
MKFRVVGVPDALTFIEGTWIRNSAHLLAPGHWVGVDRIGGKPPKSLHYRAGDVYHSVDLSKATDGLSHDAIAVVIDGLAARGMIRPADIPLARRSLGLEPLSTWDYGSAKFESRRGSPMGTPLSFPVLSWINAWASQAFDSSAHHGDDCVGVTRRRGTLVDQATEAIAQLGDYERSVAAVGAQLNRSKTYTSTFAWTMCEVLGGPGKGRKGEPYGSRTVVFVPPPCPPPALSAPVAAEYRCGSRYLKRQERVMKTLFPWVVKDARLHLPVEVGGLGYTGRGLSVGRALRSRLAALVSRDPSEVVSTALNAKAPFREVGLYPRPFVPAYHASEYWKAQRTVKSFGPLRCSEAEGGVRVPLRSLVIFEALLIEDQMRLSLNERTAGRRAVRGRPERTKTKAVFRAVKGVKFARPLGKRTGVSALRAWAAKCKNLTVTVFEDIASEIRERIPDPTYGQPRPGVGDMA